jgi:hypothetical protein
MAWLVSIATSLLERVLSTVVVKIMEWYRAKKQTEVTNDDVDKRLELLKEAYKRSFDGNPVTPQQREELKHAIREFIRGNASAGGM